MMTKLVGQRRTRGTRLRAAVVIAAAAVLVGTTGGTAHAGPTDHYGTPPVNGGTFYISNQNSGLCMDVRNRSSANTTAVQQYHCYVTWNQQFVLAHIGSVNGVDAWRIKPRFAQTKCLDVIDGKTAEGQGIQIWDCHDVWQQMFELKPIISSPYIFQIRPVYNHWCVGSANRNNELQQLAEYHCGEDNGQGGASQSWALSY
jgi:Ricin-type beta-trefoil lectin domain-like